METRSWNLRNCMEIWIIIWKQKKPPWQQNLSKLAPQEDALLLAVEIIKDQTKAALLLNEKSETP